MKFVREFRDPALARVLAAEVHRLAQPDRLYRFMEFCGGHTHAIARHGLTDLLPDNVQLIHGPGCPVCVLPIGRVDQAIALAGRPEVILCAYGDCLRVPGSGGDSLLRARSRGADVRLVPSTTAALALARAHPAREVVFFAIGFETTTPPTALAIRQAAAEGLRNFSILCCHVLTPPAIAGILASPEGSTLDGLIGPAHVSTVIGMAPYQPFVEQAGKPVVIAGFEPLDVLQAVRQLVQQVNDGRAEVENEYARAVDRMGNRKAQAVIEAVFELRPAFEWRGLGTLPWSARQLRPAYAAFDAEQRFGLAYRPVPDHKACECGAILRGRKGPTDCRIFGTACTPETPLGACMVSPEGACAAAYTYGRGRPVAGGR